ncbi:MAG: DMT family transporter [Pseudomonadota bacterium]
MPLLALAAVLLAACTHATWNLAAKRAAGSRHFVFWYSAVASVVYLPIVLWIIVTTRPEFTAIHWLSLLASCVLHIGYSLTLQAGYRHADLSLVYPLARGSGPLLSFFLAVTLLGEPISGVSIMGVLLIVVGIVLVTGLFFAGHREKGKGILYGLGTGIFIASYTINDGYAVKALLISPFFVDYAGNLFRAIVLAPTAWRDRSNTRDEFTRFRSPIFTVSILGPLGYILVLYAMQLAPISHVAPARELSTLVGTWLGAKLLQEKSAPTRLAGAVLIVSGVVALALAG